MTISEAEYEELLALQQVIDILIEGGTWKRLDGSVKWVVEESAATEAFELLSQHETRMGR